MTNFPDQSIFDTLESGDSGIENLYIYGKLNYDFKNDDIIVNSINVTSPSVFSGDVTFSSGVDLNASLDVNDNLVVQKSSTLGNSTDDSVIVNGHLYVNRSLRDADGDTGSSGQLLSSTGSGTNWIDANTTSVANSINVGTNLNSTNADQFVTFVGSSSGNNPIRVDNELKYNPSTNRLTAGSFAGDGSALTGVESFVTGMIILWYGDTTNVPTGFVLCDGNNSTPDLRGKFVAGAGNADFTAGSTGGNNSLTLSEANLPSHRHFVVSNDLGGQNRTNSNVSANNQVRKGTGASNLFEGYNLASTGSDAASGRSSAVGSGTPIDNKPAYHALCYIMKT